MPDDLPVPAPDRLLDPAELLELACLVAGRPQLWRDSLDRDRTQRTYTDVFTNDHVGIWAISWVADDHDTGYHDHDCSAGAVQVAEGVIRHEHLRLGERPTGEAVPAGRGFCFDRTAIHRMRHEPGAGPTVTIHAYSPPLVETGQYGQHADGELHRTPGKAEEQLRPHGRQGTPTTGVR